MSLSAPPVALPHQQTQEQRKASLIKTVRNVCKHQKVITTFRGSEDKDLSPKIGYPGSSMLLQEGML
jgi:hypothetical protein